MYKPFHPAILRMIQQSVRAAHNAGIQISLCGEMAADPLCAFVLLGLDVKGLSMNAGGIPVIKKIIRSISIEESKAALEEIFRLETAKEIREYVSTRVNTLLPDFDEIKNQQAHG
jgi:phosphotransferase system enzyme I (PtsI)